MFFGKLSALLDALVSRARKHSSASPLPVSIQKYDTEPPNLFEDDIGVGQAWSRRTWYTNSRWMNPCLFQTVQTSCHKVSSVLSCFSIAAFNGMNVETEVLKDRGISESAIPTLINVRKATSHWIFGWCKTRHPSPWEYSMSCVIAFLQPGLDQYLTLSTLKEKVSTFSNQFQEPLASNSLVKNY